MEVAKGEAHARHRAAKADFIFLVEIEARFERNALDRRAHCLTANLNGVAGQPDVANRTGAGKLDRTDRAHVIENSTRAAGAVEAGEREYLAGHEPAGFIGVHHSGERRGDHRTGSDRSQHKTRKHAATPTHRARVTAGRFFYPLLTITTVATLEQVGW
jgi:hypothetical protein